MTLEYRIDRKDRGGWITQRSLSAFYLTNERRLQSVPSSSEIDAYQYNMRNSARLMHCAAKGKRGKQIRLNNTRERGVNVINFTVGDYVSRVDEEHGKKLQVMWVRPYQVTRVDTHSFRVKHLVAGDEQADHASGLKFYSDDSLEVTDGLLKHVFSQGIVLSVDKLKDPKWVSAINDFDIFILIGWKDL
ncbi:LOW QUALITY PROTEIN: hypothetical protein PHMEG_00024611 [Phytophthora megakarya]|uniref:Uncharacterized protein n=1 Tax=Phytophthora megakarya TaxID=4795 RepID=A0A225VGK7_9STRA|nr:LOW QUALITY PROTEIN: hypothetical protein PHMEG_00024611 [Phytophthora megakarya]